jgi:hypothetical protein
MEKEMFSLNEYNEDKQEQDFLNQTTSLYDSFDDNQCRDNFNQSIHFDSINQIDNPDALNEDQKKSLFGPQEQQENKDYESQINELKKIQNAHFNGEKQEKSKEEKNEIKQMKEAEKKENKVPSINKKEKINFTIKGKKQNCRYDYLIKKIKKYAFSIKAKKQLEVLIKKCRFQGALKNAKVYLPDYQVFTSTSKYKKNHEFLLMTLREIFSLGNKQKNEELFNRISNSTNYQNQEAYDELKNYLNKTGEKIIMEFYDSQDFEKFKEENKEDDENFKQEKKFSFMENYGFLKLIKNDY